MGYMTHHAVVITFNGDTDQLLMNEVLTLLEGSPGVSVSEAVMNNYRTVSLVLGSDGSKDGWDDSIDGDTRRDDLVALLRKHDHKSWVEVSYGGSDPDLHTKLLRHGGEQTQEGEPT